MKVSYRVFNRRGEMLGADVVELEYALERVAFWLASLSECVSASITIYNPEPRQIYPRG